MQELLRGRTGPVVRHVERIADSTISNTRGLALAHFRSGQYDRSFVKRFEMRARGPSFVVTNVSEHAMILERGSVPHIIRPKRQGGVLRFIIAGRVIYARQVNHPGTSAYHLMELGLTAAMAEHS